VRLRTDQQLFLSYLILISALTIGISAGAESVLRRHLMRSIEDGLRRELALGRSMYETMRDATPDSVADLIGGLSGRRATIVTPGGLAVGESAEVVREGPPAEDYRFRPEVRGAFDEGDGRAIRYSSTLGVDHLYLATITARGDVLRLAVPLTEIDATLAEVQRRIVAVGVVAVLLAALFSLWFTLVVTRPLRSTVQVARAMGAGDLSRRVPVRGDDELGDLGSALNTLADELQRRLGQLEGERAEMQALIDAMSEGVLALTASGELRRANPAARRMFSLAPGGEGITPEMVSRRPEFLELVDDALRGKPVPPRELAGEGRSLLATAQPLPQGGAVLVFLDISELRRLEGVRRDFVANASHELKTPLTAIRGFSETLLDPDLPRDLQRRFAETVRDNADRLQRIIDDLLDLSRIEAGGWRIVPTDVDVRRLIEEVWSAHTSASAADAPRLEIDLDPAHTMVRADAGALRQILVNLLGNSLRYTPPAGAVTVRTRRSGEGAGPTEGAGPSATREDSTVFEVSDTGAGIPAAHLSRIFERFYRADPARSREAGGTGLGLAIVKHLVEAHGGWIEAESEIGQGTTIRFAIPSAAPAAVFGTASATRSADSLRLHGSADG
jgi:two-component system, OmpR family, phosphate regulon sensor histidine kinase PhoR